MGEYYLVIEDYLMHTGRSKVDGAPVGSGRYPLGSGERPYQKGSPGGDRRLFGRKRRNKEQPLPKLTDEEKQQIINTGNVREAYKYKRDLTNADIDAVITRYNKEKSLADLIPKKKTGMDHIKKLTTIMDTTVKAVTSGINVWNTAARIRNGFKPDDTPWPYIYNIGNPKPKNNGK